MKNIINKKIVFILLFVVLAYASNYLKLTKVWGAEGEFFTAFQFLGPLPGAFLGSFFGPLAVLLAQIIALLTGATHLTWLAVLRVLPMVFGAWYFSNKNWRKLNSRILLVVPIVAIVLFMVHPIGRQVWFYSFYWLIPLIARLPYLRKNILMRSLGATFTAHSVGSIIFLYTLPTTATMWIALLPITALERGIFALGIMASYVIMAQVLNLIPVKFREKILALS